MYEIFYAASMSESYSSVNRRPMDVEDYFDIVRRHKAWILGPAFCRACVVDRGRVPLAGYVCVTGIIRVVPPQVPESYVPTNVNSQMSQRINSMYQTISSRGNLTNIINLFNLYRADRSRKPMEDVVEQMQPRHQDQQRGSSSQGERGDLGLPDLFLL